MNNQIFYLLGAGASANAMPIFNDMQDRLRIFQFWLCNKIELNDEIIRDYSKTIPRIINELDTYKSIDTYLRTLQNISYEDEDEYDTYTRYKSCYMIYLLWESRADKDFYNTIISESHKPEKLVRDYLPQDAIDIPKLKAAAKNMESKNMGYIDSRYLDFFTELVIGEENKLPSNINILTWNYDLQIDSALSKTKYSEVESFLFSNKGSICNYQLIRLNGKLRKNLLFSHDGHKLKDMGNIKHYLSFATNHRKEQGIEFVWESPGTTEDKRKKLSSFFKSKINPQNKDSKPDDNEQRTIQLIVIGYSFPFSNRQIDFGIIQGILENLAPKDEFEIVIQCPSEEDCNTSEERIKNFVSYFYNEREKNSDIKPTKDGYFANIKYRHVTSVREFYIPNTIGL